MKIKSLFFFFSIIFFFLGCVPKIEKVETTKDSQIIDELKIIDINEGKNLSTNWWQIFGDEQLNLIISKALNQSYNLKSIEQRFKKANTIIKAIESQNLPNISFESSLTKERFSENHIFPAPLGGGIFNEYHSATTLEYKFDFWNERKSKILSAKNLALAQKAFIENAKLNLEMAICETYLSWNYNEKKIEYIDKIIEVLYEELEIIKQKYDVGLIDQITLNKKKAQIAQMQFNEYSIKEIIKGQITTLTILSGQLPSFSQNLIKPNIKENISISLPNDVYLNFLSKRADIAIQKYIVLSNEENINVAKTKFYPNINLNALLGFTSFISNDFITKASSVPSAGFALDLPIFDWGKREANLEDGVITYNSSVYEYNEILIKAVNEVFEVLKKLEYKELQIKMHHKQLESNEINEKIAGKRFDIGLNDKISYNDSKIDTLIVHLNQMDLIESRVKLELNLIKSIGGGFKEEDLTNVKG